MYMTKPLKNYDQLSLLVITKSNVSETFSETNKNILKKGKEINMEDESLMRLRSAAILHDIGKINIDLSILLHIKYEIPNTTIHVISFCQFNFFISLNLLFFLLLVSRRFTQSAIDSPFCCPNLFTIRLL